jgi:hypothetical protein
MWPGCTVWRVHCIARPLYSGSHYVPGAQCDGPGVLCYRARAPVSVDRHCAQAETLTARKALLWRDPRCVQAAPYRKPPVRRALLCRLCRAPHCAQGSTVRRPLRHARRRSAETLAVCRAPPYRKPLCAGSVDCAEPLTARRARLCGEPHGTQGAAVQDPRCVQSATMDGGRPLLPDQIGFVSQFAVEARSAVTLSLLRLALFLGPLSKAHARPPTVFLDELDPGCF